MSEDWRAEAKARENSINELARQIREHEAHIADLRKRIDVLRGSPLYPDGTTVRISDPTCPYFHGLPGSVVGFSIVHGWHSQDDTVRLVIVTFLGEPPPFEGRYAFEEKWVLPVEGA